MELALEEGKKHLCFIQRTKLSQIMHLVQMLFIYMATK